MKKRYLKMVRSALRSLRHPRLRHRPWWKSITKPVANRQLWIPCRDTVAHGLAIGLFFSLIPIPFQMLPAALVAIRAKANIPFAMAACWITNPLTTGPILWAQYTLGNWMCNTLRVPVPHFTFDALSDWIRNTLGISIPHFSFDVPNVGNIDIGNFNAASFLLGMFTIACLAPFLAYPLVHLFSAIMPHHLPVRKKVVVAPVTETE